MAKGNDSGLPPIDWATFAGLHQPRTTQVPDDLFDWIMPYLTGAELKVLLYIIRRTFGFKKEADAISLDQLCNGIVRRDGRRLDYGTGLKRPTVLEALRSLRAKNLIIAQQQLDPATGTRPTIYALRLQPSPASAPPMATRGSMSEHTRGYAAIGQSSVKGVGQSIPWASGGVAPQETVKTTNRQQEHRAEEQQTAAGWKETDASGQVIAGNGTAPTSAAHALWSEALAQLQEIMTPENYTTWLAPTRVVHHDGDCLYVAAAQLFHRDWLDYKLRHRVEAALKHIGHPEIKVEFVVFEA
jgi:hypothetical protein